MNNQGHDIINSKVASLDKDKKTPVLIGTGAEY